MAITSGTVLCSVAFTNDHQGFEARDSRFTSGVRRAKRIEVISDGAGAVEQTNLNFSDFMDELDETK